MARWDKVPERQHLPQFPLRAYTVPQPL